MSPIHLESRLNGVVLAFLGVALLFVAIDLNFSLNAPHPAAWQVAGVQRGNIPIPSETAIVQNLFLIAGTALISWARSWWSSGTAMAECGNSKAPLLEDATTCPACGAEFA